MLTEPVKLSAFCTLDDDQTDTDFKGVKFTRTSPDGEEGFPGELKVSSWYLLSDNDKMLMVWEAEMNDKNKEQRM